MERSGSYAGYRNTLYRNGGYDSAKTVTVLSILLLMQEFHPSNGMKLYVYVWL